MPRAKGLWMLRPERGVDGGFIEPRGLCKRPLDLSQSRPEALRYRGAAKDLPRPRPHLQRGGGSR
jgi:hypothetical protein